MSLSKLHTTKKFKSIATQYENVVAINQHCHLHDNCINQLKQNYFFHEETVLALLGEHDALAADTVRYLICQFLQEKNLLCCTTEEKNYSYYVETTKPLEPRNISPHLSCKLQQVAI